jgi:HicA toxin of bacterial toxin-antitoxin,
LAFPKKLVKELARLNFEYKRQAKDSHEQWLNTNRQVTLNVPRNLYSRHTANGILKKAGSTKKF